MVKVKVMHIPTVIISQTVNNEVSIIITIKYEVAYGLSITIFRFNLGLF